MGKRILRDLVFDLRGAWVQIGKKNSLSTGYTSAARLVAPGFFG